MYNVPFFVCHKTVQNDPISSILMFNVDDQNHISIMKTTPNFLVDKKNHIK